MHEGYPQIGCVVVNDGTAWFTYRIARKPYRTVPGDTAVVDPVPRGSGFDGPGRYLTLTTCDPEWGSSHRLIAWAHLDAVRPVSEGRPPELSGSTPTERRFAPRAHAWAAAL
ncbi:hypothetical protein SCALM49S_04512 [Streptomyces californicus]